MTAIEKMAREHDALLASYRGLLAANARGDRIEVDLQGDSWQAFPAPGPMTLEEFFEAARARAGAETNGEG